jgi:hypothetical protein
MIHAAPTSLVLTDRNSDSHTSFDKRSAEGLGRKRLTPKRNRPGPLSLPGAANKNDLEF